jgi:hypothetical protein
MALPNIVGTLLKSVTEPVVAYLNTRQELKSKERIRKLELQEAIHQRQVDLIKEGLHADMNWEMEFAKQASSTWKDEYTLIVVSIPAILAFIRIPGLDGPGIVTHGFEALSATPGWYQIMLVSIFFATYGIRYWRRSQSDT